MRTSLAACARSVRRSAPPPAGGSPMTPERFWLVGTRGRVAVIHDETEALELARGGVYEASGPYVPETELAKLRAENERLLGNWSEADALWIAAKAEVERLREILGSK